MARSVKKSEERTEFHQRLGYVAKSSIIVLVSVFLAKILTYAYKAVIAQNFGPAVYGLYSLALMVAGWFIALSSLGLAEGLLRFMPIYAGKKEWGKLRFVFRKGFRTLCITGIIFSALLFIGAEVISVQLFHDNELIPFLRWFSITVILTILASPFVDALMVFEKIRLFSFISNVLPNLARIIFLVLFISLGLQNNAIIYSHVLGVALVLIASILVAFSYIPVLRGHIDLQKREKKNIWSDVLSYSWPILFLGIVSNIFYWIDTFFIGYYIDAYEVGIYNAAVPIALLLGFVPSLVMTVLFPLINKEYARKKLDVVRDLNKQVGKWIFLLNLPLLCVFLIFPETFIQILFGAEFIRAAASLQVIAFGSFAYALGVSALGLISMLGKSRLILIIYLAGSLLNAFLNMLWVPRYGIIGAAFSTMLMYFAVTCILLFYTKKYLNTIPLRRKVLRILLIGLMPALVLWGVTRIITVDAIGAIVLCILYGLVYLALLFTTGCLDSNDLYIWNALRKKLFRDV
ncbi:flippase [Candidatus Pacearchaeota archaeon]|nr:flippase [Candidatus Pacearchaeota archaeon]